MNGVEIVTNWLTPTVLFCILNLMIGTIFITSTLNPHTNPKILNDDQQQPPQLSLFQRLKSINLSRDHQPADLQQPDHDVDVRNKPQTAAARVLKKSKSEKVVVAKREEEVEVEVDRQRPATVKERTAGEDEAVDAKADDFINRFRQQLKLQRVDSILRYKEMLNRGTRQ